MKNFRMVKRVMATTIAAAILGFGSLASATVIGGTSDAYNASIGLSALSGLVDVQVGPINAASGTAPALYDRNASIDVYARAIPIVNTAILTAGLNAGLSTGLLVAHAGSDVDGTSGAKSAEADQIINGLNLGIHSQERISLPLLGGFTLLDTAILGVTARTITSNASVNGDYGALALSGSSIFEALQVRVFDRLIDLSPYLDLEASLAAGVGAGVWFRPNSTIELDALGLANVDLILNEQIMGGDGSGRGSMEVNAIHLKLNDSALLGTVLNSDIVIGHSYAELWGEESPAPVPEPSTFVLSGLGLAGLFLLRRRAVKA